MSKTFGTGGCKLSHIRAVELEEIASGLWRETWYYIDHSGVATYIDKQHEVDIYNHFLLETDSYYCTHCRLGLFGWLDVVAHTDDFEEDEEDLQPIYWW